MGKTLVTVTKNTSRGMGLFFSDFSSCFGPSALGCFVFVGVLFWRG